MKHTHTHASIQAHKRMHTHEDCLVQQNCPLQDDSKHFIDALRAAHVEVDHKHDPSCTSGFLGLPFMRHNEGFWQWLTRAIVAEPHRP